MKFYTKEESKRRQRSFRKTLAKDDLVRAIMHFRHKKNEYGFFYRIIGEFIIFYRYFLYVVRCLLARGEMRECKRELDEAIANFGHEKIIKKEEALYYIKRSTDECERAIELDPNNAELYKECGELYWEKININKAIKCYNKAIELKPDYAEAYYSRAVVYNHLWLCADIHKGKRYNDKIIEDCNKAIELNQNCSQEVYNRRDHAYQNAEFYKSIEKHNKALEQDPNNAEIYAALASAYFSCLRSRYDDKAMHKKAIEYYNKAMSKKALEYYNKAIELNPNDEKIWQNLEIIQKESHSTIGEKQ